MKFAMFLSFGLQKLYYRKDGKSKKMPNFVLRPYAAGGLFISKPSRAHVQQEVIKVPQIHFLKATLKKPRNISNSYIKDSTKSYF